MANVLIHSFIHKSLGRCANHDHLTSSLKHIIKQTSNQIVLGALSLMFVNRVAMIARREGKPLVLQHL